MAVGCRCGPWAFFSRTTLRIIASAMARSNPPHDVRLAESPRSSSAVLQTTIGRQLNIPGQPNRFIQACRKDTKDRQGSKGCRGRDFFRVNKDLSSLVTPPSGWERTAGRVSGPVT